MDRHNPSSLVDCLSIPVYSVFQYWYLVKDKLIMCVNRVVRVSIICFITFDVISCHGALFLISKIIFLISCSCRVRKIYSVLASNGYLFNEGPDLGICGAGVLPILTMFVLISKLVHDKWGWSQSLYPPISVRFQENTVPVHGARCKVQMSLGLPTTKDIEIW